MAFEEGFSGAITCSLFSLDLLRIEARVTFERGEMRALNPVAPQIYHHLTVRTERGSRRERLSRVASYECQLRAFAAAVLEGAPILTPADDSVKNMRVIDAVYRAAGLSPRGLSSSPAPAR
jgi:predicted dehydrogenase